MKSPLKLNIKRLLLVVSALSSVLLFSTAALAVHSEHTAKGVPCMYCHGSFYHPTTGLPADYTYVQSFLYLGDGSQDAGGSYDGVGFQCLTVACHGENTVQAQGETVTCASCHTRTAGADATDVDDFVFGGASPVMAKIDPNEWTGSGHGRTTAFTPGSDNPAPNADGKFNSCGGDNYCHDSSVKHDDPVNPFRLRTASGIVNFTDAEDPQSTLENTVCLDCHASTGGYWYDLSDPKATIYVGTMADLTRHFLGRHSNVGQTAGGNFCWDCHDPHGDGNDFMIQDKIAKRSDGTYGKPAPTFEMPLFSPFPDTSGTHLWTDFVNPDPDYNGLCQVCHENTSLKRFTNEYLTPAEDYDTAHNQGQKCTNCHKHSGGFEGAGGGPGADCGSCHDKEQGTPPRRIIRDEFDLAYQHAETWTNFSFTTGQNDCELCHHGLHNSGDGTITLKVWAAGVSGDPNLLTDSTPEQMGGQYDPAHLDSVTPYVIYSRDPADTQGRNDRTLVNKVCLSCHDGEGLQFFSQQPAATIPPDIGSRWNNDTTGVAYNKYAPKDTIPMNNTVPVLSKAYSPHKNVGANDAKVDMDVRAGQPSAIDQRTVNKIACLDCHPSHGSNRASATLIVDNAVGWDTTANSKMLKNPGYPDPPDPEEDLCWGCHVGGMDYYGDSDSPAAPAMPVSRWQGQWNNNTVAPYKNGYDYISSHFYPSRSVAWSGGAPVDPVNDKNPGFGCTTCHDPHGVDPNAGADQIYRLPILRGNWLTSPYKEDRAPGAAPGRAIYNGADNTFGDFPRVVPFKAQANVASGAGYSDGDVGATPGYEGYFIDQNSIGIVSDGSSAINGATYNGYITEYQDKFGGLCLSVNCHVATDLWIIPARNFTGHNTVNWDTANRPPAPVPGTTYYTNIFMSNPVGPNGTGLPGPWGDELQIAPGGSEWAMQYYANIGGTGLPYWNDGFQGGGKYGTRNKQLTSGKTPIARSPVVDDWGNYAFNGSQGSDSLNNWGIDYTKQTTDPYVQDRYHRYPCAKCHTPHASRLPRLMRTNCLDNGSFVGNYYESTTDYKETYILQDAAGTSIPTGNHTPKVDSSAVWDLIANPVAAAGPTLQGPNLMNFEAANCHSVGGSSSGGWNKLTPWNDPVQPNPIVQPGPAPIDP
jgi:hypothetical protein